MAVKTGTRLTIGTKLVGLIAVLLIISVASLVWLSTRMFIEDNTALIQQMNADAASGLATQMREFFESTNEKMRVLGVLLLDDKHSQPLDAPGSQTGGQRGAQSTPRKNPAVGEFFAKDKDFLGVIIYRHPEGSLPAPHLYEFSDELHGSGDPNLNHANIASLLNQEQDFSLDQVASGDVQVTTIQLSEGNPVVALAVPFIESEKKTGKKFSHTLVALIKQSRFLKAFGESGVVSSFMVDGRGRLLAHLDVPRVSARENLSHLGIVKQLLDGKATNGQTRYMDQQANEWKLGAFRLVGFGGLAVIAEVPESKAFEAARKVEYRAKLIAALVLFIAFLTGYVYSGTITGPIKQLVGAAGRISEGDFKINLKPRSRDEIGHLALAFNDMAKGLEERDKVKETFNKFHNKEIAEKILSGEVKLGGEHRVATIFFSDVRGFTAMSETMEPQAVVEMLNEYMTKMVAIIRAHGGVVDKYVGDAIMALWGVPIEGSNDAFNALRACIEMRRALEKLNELRISRGQPVLKIGMGINSGSVIAGNIGSNEKMEYTVIGDSVNLASRIESMTKEYGTDLLISKSVYEKVKDKFVFEACRSAKVKGKSSSIEVFKVTGYLDENGQQVIVQTPYSSYQSEKSDKVMHEDSTPSSAGDSVATEDQTGSFSLLMGIERTKTIDLTVGNPDGNHDEHGPAARAEITEIIRLPAVEKTEPTPPPFQKPAGPPPFKKRAA